MDEPLSPYYYSTKKPKAPVVEKPVEKSSEDHLRTLRVLLQAYTAASISDKTEAIRREFREDQKDEFPEHLIEEVFAEMLPDEEEPTVMNTVQVTPVALINKVTEEPSTLRDLRGLFNQQYNRTNSIPQTWKDIQTIVPTWSTLKDIPPDGCDRFTPNRTERK